MRREGFFPLVLAELRGCKAQANLLLSGAQLNVGRSYQALADSHQAIIASAVKCERSRALIEEVDGEIKSYRETGVFKTPPLQFSNRLDSQAPSP